MKDSARYATVITILDQILENPHKPSDSVVGHFLRHNRYIGSKDRSFITNTIYSVLRLINVFETLDPLMSTRMKLLTYLLIKEKGDLKIIESLCQGERYGLSPLTPTEITILNTSHLLFQNLTYEKQLGFAQWMVDEFKNHYGEKTQSLLKSLNEEANLDVRVNLLKTTRPILKKKMEEHTPQESLYSPWGLRFKGRFNVKAHPLFKEGLFEVQDEGSQIISLLCAATPSDRVLDFCAGAGGKSLAMAACMNNKGAIVATDIHQWRLDKTKERCRRLGIHNIQTRLIEETFLKRQRRKFSIVLVDAPCSGTGTIRRHPEKKHTLTSHDVNELVELQKKILQQASNLVKDGGRLVYATCSLLKRENEDVCASFLESNKEIFDLIPVENVNLPSSLKEGEASPYLRLSPHEHGMDGFFVAIFKKKELP